jgi:hypothetical protein
VIHDSHNEGGPPILIRSLEAGSARVTTSPWLSKNVVCVRTAELEFDVSNLAAQSAFASREETTEQASRNVREKWF